MRKKVVQIFYPATGIQQATMPAGGGIKALYFFPLICQVEIVSIILREIFFLAIVRWPIVAYHDFASIFLC